MDKKFPKQIPVFPLSGVIYFPKTNLPLNIFEDRYLQLVEDCMKHNKLMGMVQSKKDTKEVYKIGCLGKISHFQKTEDGRALIKLTGITRFEIVSEVNNSKLYREFKVQYKKFSQDIENIKPHNYSETIFEELFEKIKIFFRKNGLALNWKEFKLLEQIQQINTLAMISPFSDEEKQKLLETVGLNEKIKILSEIVEFYLYDKDSSFKTRLQ